MKGLGVKNILEMAWIYKIQFHPPSIVYFLIEAAMNHNPQLVKFCCPMYTRPRALLYVINQHL
jgi:hypothetical protein